MFDHRVLPDTRVTLTQALQEARDIGSREITAAHLILGMLCNVRSEAFRPLTQAGIDLDAARAVLAEQPAVSEENEDERRYVSDREVLASVGIDLDAIRKKVLGSAGGREFADIAVGWGRDRRGDRRGRGRGGFDRRGGVGRDGGPGRRGGWDPRGEFADRGRDDERGRGGRGGRGDFARGDFGRDFGRGDDRHSESRGGWDGDERRGPGGRGRGFGRLRFSPTARAAFDAAVLAARDSDESAVGDKALLRAILETGDPAMALVVGTGSSVEDLLAALNA